MTKNELSRGRKRLMAWLALAAIFLLPVSVFSQTKISYHSNKFKPEEDVRLGRQAAQEAEQQMPILRDREATDYLATRGPAFGGGHPARVSASRISATLSRS